MSVIILNSYRAPQFVASTAYRDTVLSNSPALYWKLDETAPFGVGKVAVDSSGNGRNGTYVSASAVIDSPALVGNDTIGTSKYFPDTAAGERIAGPAGAFVPLAFPFTMEAWCNLPSLTTTCQVFATNASGSGNYSGAYVNVSTTGDVGVSFGTPALASSQYRRTYSTNTSPIQTNTTYHIVVVCTNINTVTLKVNDILVPMPYVSGTLLVMGTAANTYPAVSHGWNDAFSNAKGYIDEVAFYLSALTAVDITTHYKIGTNQSAPSTAYRDLVLSDNPILYWKLDGSTPIDETGTHTSIVGGSPTFYYPSLISPLVDAGASILFPTTGSQSVEGNAGGLFTTNQGSVEIWFSPTWNSGDSTTHTLCTSETGSTNHCRFTHYFNNNWYIGFVRNGIDYRVIIPAATMVVAAGNRYHLVFTWNVSGGGAKVYLNGVLKGSQPTMLPLPSAPSTYIIGNGGGSNAGAAMDEVALYDYDLSLPQIQNHYNTGA